MSKPSSKISKLKIKEKSCLLYKIQEKHSEHTKVSKCAILIGAGCSYPILPLGSELIKLCQLLSYIREIFPLEAAKVITDFLHKVDFSILENFINSKVNPKKSFSDYISDKELILKDSLIDAKEEYLKKVPSNLTNPDWDEFESFFINDSKYSFWMDSYSNSPKERQRLIEALIDNKNPGGAYIILALLIEMGYFSNILTTNFDDFINDALLYYTSARPRFYADDELSQYISVYSGKPNIIKLHGDYRYANIRNTAEETLRLSNKMEEKLKELLQNFDLIVIGYNGADYSIMNVLQQAKSPNCELLWCGKDENDVHWRVANLINRTDNSWFVKTNSFDDLIKDFYLNFIQSPPDLLTKAKTRQDEIKSFVLEYSKELQKDESTSDKEKTDLKNKDILWELYTKALNQQDNLEKINICNDILHRDNKYWYAYNLIGVAYFNLEKYEESIENYTKALEIKTDDSVIYTNRGYSFLRKKNSELALLDFNSAIRVNSKDGRAYSFRVVLYEESGNYEMALVDHNIIVELENSAIAYNNRGHCYFKLNKHELAISDFNKAIELNSAFANPHKHLGNIYLERHEFEKALKELNIAIEFKNDYIDAYKLRAKIHHSLNDDQKAKDDEQMVKSFK